MSPDEQPSKALIELLSSLDEHLRPCILDENHAVKQVSFREFIEWERADPLARRVAFADMGQGVTVSTVFLAVSGKLFETMTFSKKGKFRELDSRTFGRYGTWDEAVKGHEAAVKAVEAIMKQVP